MRQHILDFVTEAVTVLDPPGPVVEIGARPAEGQEAFTDPRSLFDGKEYIGCDIQPGPRVDRVEDVHSLGFADETVGTVLMLDTLEHVRDPIRALTEAHRVLIPNGVLIMTSVMFFPIHAHPWDYWRFTPEGFSMLLAPFESSLAFGHGFEPMPDTIFGVGIKGPYDGLALSLFPKTSEWIERWGQDAPVDLGPIRLTRRQLWALTLRETMAAARQKIGRP
jgi:SAM-dependent methyltransferase